MVYAIFCDDEFDQLCYTQAQADKEKKDLAKMGFSVRVKTYESEDAFWKTQD